MNGLGQLETHFWARRAVATWGSVAAFGAFKMRRDPNSYEAKNLMYWWGWCETRKGIPKYRASGEVIARRGDAVWKADIDKAIDPNLFRG
jgi:hypothetical protein